MRLRNTTLIIFLMLLIGSASAVIPVSVTDTGCTYIQWNWTPGLTLTDMFLDGNVLCGYETTDPGFLATGLSSGELHNLTIITAGDSGTNLTYTSTTNCTAPGTNVTSSGGNGEDTIPFMVLGIIGGLVIMSARKLS